MQGIEFHDGLSGVLAVDTALLLKGSRLLLVDADGRTGGQVGVWNGRRLELDGVSAPRRLVAVQSGDSLELSADGRLLALLPTGATLEAAGGGLELRDADSNALLCRRRLGDHWRDERGEESLDFELKPLLESLLVGPPGFRLTSGSVPIGPRSRWSSLAIQV